MAKSRWKFSRKISKRKIIRGRGRKWTIKKEIRTVDGAVMDEGLWQAKEEKDMRDMMVDYSIDFRDWYMKHTDRLTSGMVDDFATSQSYMKATMKTNKLLILWKWFKKNKALKKIEIN